MVPEVSMLSAKPTVAVGIAIKAVHATKAVRVTKAVNAKDAKLTDGELTREGDGPAGIVGTLTIAAKNASY